MSQTFKAKAAISTAAILIAAAGAYWLYYLFTYQINADNAVLGEFAMRIIGGGRYGFDFIDTNPPYNIYLYVPVALLASIGIPLYHGMTLYGLAALTLSSALTWNILKHFTFITAPERITFLTAYIIANLAMSSIFFAERDLLIFNALLPFVLSQFALNNNIKIGKAVQIIALIFGAALIMIKPHYGLMPALMIGARLTSKPKLSSLLKPDFFALAAAVLIYTGINALFFASYWREIFPYLSETYLFHKAAALLIPFFRITTLAVIGILSAAFFYADTRKKSFILMLGTFIASLMAAYLAQYKGFFYHLLPAMMLAFATASMMIWPKKPAAALTLGTLLLLWFFPARPNFPTHQNYADLPLAQALNDCEKPCTFLLDNELLFGAWETALYTGSTNATRFSSFWFEPQLACSKNLDHFDQYSQKIAEDVARYKPQVIILHRDLENCAGQDHPPEPFETLFSKNAAFKTEWARYRFDHTLELNRRLYFGDTTMDKDHIMRFDIFRRK